MNKVNEVLIHTFVAEDGSGEGADVELYPHGRRCLGKARFLLDVTEITGTDMAIDIFGVVGGVDYLLGSFTDASATGKQVSLFIDACPPVCKVIFTENTITTFSATVRAVAY